MGVAIIIPEKGGVEQEFIGLGIGFDAGQAELFDETILEQADGYVDSAIGLGRVCPDNIDAEFLHCAFNLSVGLFRVNRILIDVTREPNILLMKPK